MASAPSHTLPKATNEPIAIIGTACRFPGGCNTPSKLWELLRAPRDLLQKVPSSRFDADAFYHPEPTHHGTTDAIQSYFLDQEIDKFDNSFFNIQPMEAEALDPQQRILLETVYDSLCDAGLSMDGLKGSDTAVYVGQMCDDWAGILYRDWDAIPTYAATGVSRAIMSNRVSYVFDWHGPSMTIDTACSSSLVAVHEAVKTLRNGESKVAIAAGVNLILSPGMYIYESNLRMLSPTGRSRMWDSSADGYARGEGFASVILKTLSQALADGDHIDGIIRETAVNQDGKTTGLTMPSNAAQTALIRETYSRAGLDINDPNDRPQFFHAHGTGTKAGDPQEAEAIWRAFFADSAPQSDKLFVGSIKTIIGHTEGTAGLASLIGSMLAMKNSVVPPNMHFNNLNPDIKPFYDDLEIPTSAQPWPRLQPGQVKRASINSFGFGGTNAHAIIESYTPPPKAITAEAESAPVLYKPLVFSAHSMKALQSLLSSHLSFLQDEPDTNLVDLAYTLHSRRSTLPYRSSVVISGTSHEEACASISGELSRISDKSNKPQRSSNVASPRVLGVFTGQGAQWPRMGAALIESSALVRDILQELDGYLAELPPSDRPSWKLIDQILAAKESSRVKEAALSQPLCTAIQIVLVDILLERAGIQLCAAVGHSSGEMGAAYAAGLISKRGAIIAAYYRGLYAHLASSPSSEVKGAMAAIGTEYDDAAEYCSLADNEGRISIAAVNSATSITLSGDEDAIDEAVSVFQDEGKFARRLVVDTAYHSNHMIAPAGPYLDALKKCGIFSDTSDLANSRNPRPQWFSSVREDDEKHMEPEDLNEQYWVDNMVQPVLFYGALRRAELSSGPFDIAIEFGPHPALKSQTLETLDNSTLSCATFQRNKNDVESLANSLGFLWRTLGHGSVDFTKFQAELSGQSSIPEVIQALPSYPFEVEAQSYWSETRVSSSFRGQGHPMHPILGRRLMENNAPGVTQWRNILRASEIPWLKGHRLQGQLVFPATGFAVLALEAMTSIVNDTKDSSVRLLSLRNFSIKQALLFQEDASSVELSVTMKTTSTSNGEIHADFLCCSCPLGEKSTTIHALGQVIAQIGEKSANTIPRGRDFKEVDNFNLSAVDPSRFQAELTKLGYQYSDPFTGLVEINRKTDYATGKVQDQSGTSWPDQLLVHPGFLDSGLQACMASFSAPGDGRMWSLIMPIFIESLHVNPYHATSAKGACMPWESTSRQGEEPSQALASIETFSPDGNHTFVLMEGIVLVPFTPATAANDNPLFSTWEYRPAEIDGELASQIERKAEVVVAEDELIRDLERASFFHLQHLSKLFPAGSEARGKMLEHFKRMLNWCDHAVEVVAKGEHPDVRPEHMQDTQADIDRIMAKHAHRNDVRLTLAAAEAFPHIMPSDGHIHEFVTKDGMLTQYYEDVITYQGIDEMLGQIMQQFAHRYPQMRILEVGAGTGAATAIVLPNVEGAYTDYTYTDISTAFFEEAEQRFKDHTERMVFKVLDMDKLPEDQGFTEGTYDVIVACMVLHATENLEACLLNVRRLLKPGGRLIAFDMVNNDSFRYGLAMGGFSGWWAGAEKGRPYGPMLTIPQWDDALRRTGYSGIDTHTTGHSMLRPMCVWVAQASDDRTTLLSQPLSPVEAPSKQILTIVGGKSLASRDLTQKLQSTLTKFYDKIKYVSSIEELGLASGKTPLFEGSSVLSLTELEEPFLRTVTDAKLNGLKYLWANARNILWVTKGAAGEDPYSSLVVGLARSIRLEYPSINLQTLDFDLATASDKDFVIQFVAEALQRLELLDTWKREEVANGARLSDKLLCTSEPELRVSDKRVYIPRLITNKDLNQRLNAQRRVTYTEVDPQASESSFSLNASAKNPFSIPTLQQISPLRKLEGPASKPSDRRIRIHQSIVQSIRIGSGGFFRLCVGADELRDGETFIALTSSTETPAITPEECTIALPSTSAEITPMALLSTAAHLVAAQVVKIALAQDGDVVIHDADPMVTSAIHNLLDPSEASRFCFTSCSQQSGADQGESTSYYIAPNMSPRLIKELLPNLQSTSTFIDFSPPNSNSETAAKAMADNLPWYARVEKTTSLLRSRVETRADRAENVTEASSALQEAWSKAMTMPVEPLSKVMSLNDLESYDATATPLAVVDWTLSPLVPVRVQPLDHKTEIFSADKTYLLVGLSGEIGQSYCSWMAAHGARYIVLTSRTPKVDQGFIDAMERAGTTVMVRSLDITDKKSLRSCYDAVTRLLPPIGGVANGAMLLQDTLFEHMDAANLNKVLAPKVKGSSLLDELFFSTDLEFFIMLSSATLVIGTRGQSNYSAANMYMASLVENRRKRGLAASIIDISAVIGLGYIERLKVFEMDFFKDIGIVNISAHDLHQTFAEAVLAGHHRKIAGGEIVTGILPEYSDKENKAPYYNDLKFNHMLLDRLEDLNNGSQGGASSASAAIPLSRLLKNVDSKPEALRVIMDAFITRLKKILRVNDDTDVPETVALVDQGVDSLVAVDVRTWFLKELDTDMPVLKILGGNSILDLCSDALERIPPALLSLDKDASNEEQSAEPIQRTSSVEEYSELTRSSTVSSNDRSSLQTPPSENTSVETPRSGRSSVKGADLDRLISLTDVPESEQLTESDSIADSEPAWRQDIIQSSSEDTDEMSLCQSRFWFLTSALEDKTTFNVTISVRLTGSVDSGKLAAALESVAERHEGLRTRLFLGGENLDTPMQGVLSKPLVRLATKNISQHSEVEAELEKMRHHIWNLGDWETIKLSLLSLTESQHWLVFACHHSALDGYSLSTFWADLSKAYNAGGSVPKLPYDSQYRAYSVKQRSQIRTKSADLRKAIAHHRKLILPEPEPLPLLPFAKVNQRSPLNEYSCHQAQVILTASEAARIRQFGKAHHATAYHVYLAGLQALLWGLLPENVDRYYIAMDDTNRLDKHFMESIGLFVNTLFLRFDRNEYKKWTFGDAVRAARSKTYTAQEHSLLPMDVLLEELQINRTSEALPVSQVLIDYRVAPKQWFKLGNNCVAEGESWNAERQGSDIFLYILDDPDSKTGSASLNINLQRSLYDQEHAELLVQAYANLLKLVTADEGLNSKKPLSQLPLWTERQLSKSFGPTVDGWPGTVSHRIDEMIRQYPSSPALNDETAKLTYEEMGHRSDEIAKALSDAGLGEGAIIGILQEPGVDWVCSILAILRLGMTYLPLYQPLGIPRLVSIAQVTQPKAILVDESSADKFDLLETTSTAKIHLPLASKYPPGQHERQVSLAQLDKPSLILCTSGSTGTPKAIVHSHRSLRGLAEPHYFNESEEGCTPTYAARVLQQSALSFDLSMDQTLSALCSAGCLHIVPASKRGDPVEIAGMIDRHQITYTMATPSEYNMWFQYAREHLANNKSWKNASTAGSHPPNTLVRDLTELGHPDLKIYNVCGPTETTVTNRGLLTLEDDISEVGKRYLTYSGPPVHNYSTYIVDENLNPVPIGCPGEILVGGAGVSNGYLGQPEVTKEKFIPDPWTTSKVWKTMYRTGDRGKLRPDGSVDLLGRIGGDTQIKLRGYRIEIGDVESAILKAAKGVLSEAIVTLRGGQDGGDADDQFLVAHVVFVQGEVERSETEAEGYLHGLLSNLAIPQYMVPVAMVSLDKLPLSQHQKPDRKAIAALPLPSAFYQKREQEKLENEAVEGEGLRSETQRNVAQLWKQVIPFSTAAITANTDFFHVGGSSLLLVKLQVLIRKSFHITLRLLDLMSASKLGDMSTLIDGQKSGNAIDWASEIKLPDEWLSLPVAARPTTDNTRLRIFLTGCTGFLGRNLLARLTKSTSVAEIHCLVRGNFEQVTSTAKGSLSDDEAKKVTFWSGDLSQPYSGLSENDFDHLSQSIDFIVHCAANRSFWDNYANLRAVNVSGVAELIRLALRHRVPFHFLSSGSVKRYSDAESIPPVDGSDGYTASKWVAESLLQDAAKRAGLPVFAYRPEQVDDAVSDKSRSTEPSQELLRLAVSMGSRPDPKGLSGTVDFAPIQGVVDRLFSHLFPSTPTTTTTESSELVITEFPATGRLNIAQFATDCDEAPELKHLPPVQAMYWMGDAKNKGLKLFVMSLNFVISDNSGVKLASNR